MSKSPYQPDLMAPVTSDAASATFSPCLTYRYTLWRWWDRSKPYWAFLMLNPSTADATNNDPTVSRCQGRARAAGAGGLAVVNLFALRSTDPAGLYTTDDPVGPENDSSILDVCANAGLVICAWGAHGKHLARAAHVTHMLKAAGVKPFALAVNADGSPKHPLYIAAANQPTPFDL